MEVKEAIIQGATQGRLSNLSGSPNLLAYVELDRPDAHWQQAGLGSIGGNTLDLHVIVSPLLTLQSLGQSQRILSQ